MTNDEEQDLSFQKLRCHFLKAYPYMTAFHLDMGAIVIPRVFIEIRYMGKKRRSDEMIEIIELVRKAVPKRMITHFQKAKGIWK